jgi:anti-sigma regulatory factor (Ser/Thr protein kinase)
MTIPHDHHGPGIELERSLPSEGSAISPFVDKLMLLFRKCGCVPQSDSDVEIALREALANAIIHGNHENPRKHVHVRCRCNPDELSIAVKDEGRGFDIDKMADPTVPESIGSVHHVERRFAPLSMQQIEQQGWLSFLTLSRRESAVTHAARMFISRDSALVRLEISDKETGFFGHR